MPAAIVAVALLSGLAILAAVFMPLIRRRAVFGSALVVASLAVASALYLLVGTPAALDPANVRAPETLADAVQRLERELERNPTQAEGWRLLADAYRAQGRPRDVARALGEAVRHAPRDPDLLAQAAEARAITAPGRRFDATAIDLLRRALAVRPDHQRSRWFLGVAQRQAGDAAGAAATWQPLLAAVDPSTASALRAQVDAARADAGLAPLPAPAAAATPSLTLTVDIAPALRRGLAPDAAIFVLAREPGGPPMPVAAKRIALSELPARVTLGDADSPMPTRRLSQLSRVEVLARLSRSGIANAQSGDLESRAVTVRTNGSATLLIDHARD